jgi:hypothetical protein
MPHKSKEARRACERARDRKRYQQGTNGKGLLNTLGATPADLLSPEVLAHVETAAAASVPPSLIAKSLGMTVIAFNKFAEANAAFREALARGHATEEMWLVNRLRQLAAGDSKQSVTAIAILLNGRHNYAGSKGPRVQQVQNNFFALPQPQSLDAYLQSLPSANPDKAE